ncbi:hypothetical protein CL618_01170 [archaeon]|nr:hypothetical protein [archaeon]|tara:strand:- start:759 stop:1871 length:1113 start_codon:yes stop_codon:yes gene_type:complete
MLNIIENFFSNKCYVLLEPSFLTELVETARKKVSSFSKLSEISDIYPTTFSTYKNSKERAISFSKLAILLDISQLKLFKDHILSVRTSRSGYNLSSKILFNDKSWKIFDKWDHYLLGVLASDGHVFNSNFYFRQTIKDVEFSAVQIFTLFNLVKKIHYNDKKIHFYITEDKSSRYGGPQNKIIFSSAPFNIFLSDILSMKFDTNYSIPFWLDSNKSYAYSWLGGLTDGDGSVIHSYDKKYNRFISRWDICNGAIEPLISIKNLLEIFFGEIKSNPNLGSKGKYVFNVGTMKNLSKLLPSILPTIVIERKRKKIIQLLDYLNDKGFGIKIDKKQRTTRNPIMDDVVRFLEENSWLKKLTNYERLETYGEIL